MNGDPVAVLLSEAQRATLIAVGSHGRRRAAGILLGTVAARMLREAPCSVLVARPARDPETWPQAIVVGVDGSSESAARVHRRPLGRELLRAELRIVAATTGSARSRSRAAIAPELEERDGRAIGVLTTESETADLIIVGSRGLQGLKALGSVSERVAHQAAAPCSSYVPGRSKEAEVDALPSVKPARARPSFGVTRVEVSGFRSAREVAFSPAPLCALVGEADAGKSNLLAAIRAVLDPAAAPLTAADMTEGGDGAVSIRVSLADGSEAALEGSPGRNAVTGGATAPPTLFLPAEERAGAVLAAWTPRREGPAAEGLRAGARPAGPDAGSDGRSRFSKRSSPAARNGLGGLVLLIEEPELYLRPQAQRYLYRLLREFSLAGNQVIYSTHSPAFLNVTRMDELVFVERLPVTGTHALQPEPVSADEDFRVMTEFDAARSELFLAHAVVLVEGLTEKLVLPFVFAALGHDVDREAISIIECGGKPNIPLFARICRAAGIPFVVVHDSDRKTSGRLAPAEQALNALIAETAGEERVIVLDPDFEAVAGLAGDATSPSTRGGSSPSAPPAEMPAPARARRRAHDVVRAFGCGGPVNDHARHGARRAVGEHRHDLDRASEHAGHGQRHEHLGHAGHADVYRRRFWITLILAIPVVVYSEMIQDWFGFTAPEFPGDGWSRRCSAR